MHQSLTISDALLDQATILLNFGNEVAPRGQKTLEMINHVFEILNPLQRNILVENRWANPFAQLAETLWVLAGRNDMDWLERYIPQCRKWSDDGTVWRAGYGPRLRSVYVNAHKSNKSDPYLWEEVQIDQIAYVISKLKEDPSTRQAVISLWDPVKDTFSGSKDYPCNNWLQFLVRDGKLYLSVVLRSNDLIYGFSHCDFYLWSVLQELVANCVGVEVGTMTWFAGSFHVYEKHWELLKEFRIVDVSVKPIRLDVNTLNRFDTLLDELMLAESRLRNDPNSNLVDIFVKSEYEYFARRSEWFAVAYIMFVGWEMKLRGYSPVEIDSLLSVHLGNSDLYYSTMLYLFKENYEQMLQVTDSIV